MIRLLKLACQSYIPICMFSADHTLHAGLDDLLQAQQSTVDDPEKLVRAAAQGHIENCKEIIRKHPNKVHIADIILLFIFLVKFLNGTVKRFIDKC